MISMCFWMPITELSIVVEIIIMQVIIYQFWKKQEIMYVVKLFVMNNCNIYNVIIDF